MEREDFEESYIPTQSIPEEEVASMIADNQMNLSFHSLSEFLFNEMKRWLSLFQNVDYQLKKNMKAEFLSVKVEVPKLLK